MIFITEQRFNTGMTDDDFTIPNSAAISPADIQPHADLSETDLSAATRSSFHSERLAPREVDGHG